MSLFINSSRQLRRITEQSKSMLKVSQNGTTILHLSFLPSKESKTYHGRYEKYTTKIKHSIHSVYLEEPTNCSSSLRRRYFFIFDKKEYTESKNTKHLCVHLEVRDTPLLQIYFSWKKPNFHVDTKT